MHARWLLLTLLMLTPPTAALNATLDIPGPVPTDGTPFEVHLTLTDLTPGPFEAKLWLGGTDWQASRTWNGSSFERSDHYTQQRTATTDTWSGWIALQANPDSTNHETLETGEAAWLGVRVRGASGRVSTGEPVALLTEPDPRLFALAPGSQAWIEVDDARVGHRSNPTDQWLVSQAALPPGQAGRVCPVSGCQEDVGVVLDRFGPGLARVRNVGAGPVVLDGFLAVQGEEACVLRGRLSAGGLATFAWTPGAREEGTAVGCARVVELWSAFEPGVYGQGAFLAGAPDRLGWGDVVREPWAPYDWASWRLPREVEPLPVRMEPVEGWAHAFATRSEGLDQVVGVIAGARERLTVATYLFTNEQVFDALVDAVARGVDVSLLVEPSPVGGLPDRQASIVERLEEAGVAVELAGEGLQGHGVQHGKVIVADGSVVLVLTENFTNSGLPVDGVGNLGLGFGVVNASLAGKVEALVGEPGASRVWVPEGWAPFSGRVGVVLSPENAWRLDGVPAWLEQAGRVDVFALRLSPDWGARPNAWLEALANVSERRPVRVYATGSPEGAREENRAAFAHLRGDPGARGLALRLSPAEEGTVHAKAWIGGDSVLVGSSNGGLGGALLNREVNLLVEDAGIADAFGAMFDAAWNGSGSASDPLGGIKEWRSSPGLSVGLGVVVVAGLAVVGRTRRGGG